MQKKFFHLSGQDCSHNEHQNYTDPSENYVRKFQRRTLYVVLVSFFAMILEIFFGYHSGSVALLADGYHMGSHVFAVGISWFAYFLAGKWSSSGKISFNIENLMSLAGFISGVILLLFSLEIVHESVDKIIHKGQIIFREAIGVAVLGFLVNLISIGFLHGDHEHHDINIRAAYLHILSDLLTSVLAILSLILGYYFKIGSIDGYAGLLSSLVVFYWSFGILSKSCRNLINYKKKK
jgi:cation diffusion facilitator family transporter